MAIGMPVNEFNENKDLEVMTFRRKILSVCKMAVEERDAQGHISQARYVYPPDVHHSPLLPPHIEESIQNGKSRGMRSSSPNYAYAVMIHVCPLR